MLIKKSTDLCSSEITDPTLYQRRREFLKLGATAMATLLFEGMGESSWPKSAIAGDSLPKYSKSSFSANEEMTPLKDVTRYNNYYEFGPDKSDPARLAHTLRVSPWTITVDGEVHKPKVFDLDELLKLAPLEERIYRLRCVEGWSMVIPWIGFPMVELMKKVEPKGTAKFVKFTTLFDPEQMPGQRTSLLEWPYSEALRIDEAAHPLTILAVGLYGEVLPNQNGAPIRLVVPWKYGFKSAKSLIHIRFTERQPQTTWNIAAPSEYGFYANVNPKVDHPRWSQAKERRIGEYFKRPTLPFNGYADQVAQLYQGMDLVANF
jgi:sulfoxide reductase catalytic subunit YedY